MAFGFVGLALNACMASPPQDSVVSPSDAGATLSGRITDLPASQIVTLEHLSAGDVVARLGPPDFTRRDPPAELWQYRGASCVLDLFLYPEGNVMKVAHAQTRNRSGTEAIGLGANLCTPFAPEETTASTS